MRLGVVDGELISQEGLVHLSARSRAKRARISSASSSAIFISKHHLRNSSVRCVDIAKAEESG